MSIKKTLEGLAIAGTMTLPAGCASHLTREEYEDKFYERILEDQKVINLTAEVAEQELTGLLPPLVKDSAKTRKEHLTIFESAKNILGTSLTNEDYGTMTLAVEAATYMHNVTQGNLAHHAHAQMLEELTTESFAEVVGPPNKKAVSSFMQVVHDLNGTFDKTTQFEVALTRYERAASHIADPKQRDTLKEIQTHILKSAQDMKRAVHYAVMLNRNLGDVTNGSQLAALYSKLDRITTGNDPDAYGRSVLQGFTKKVDGKKKSLLSVVRTVLDDGISSHFEARKRTLPTRIAVTQLYRQGKIDAPRLWSALHTIDAEERSVTQNLPKDSQQLELYDFSPVGIVTGNYNLLTGRKGLDVDKRKDFSLVIALNYAIGPGLNTEVNANRFAIGCAYLSTFGIASGIAIPLLKGGNGNNNRPTGGRGPETGGNDVTGGRSGRTGGGNDVSFDYGSKNQDLFALQRVNDGLHKGARTYRVRRDAKHT